MLEMRLRKALRHLAWVARAPGKSGGCSVVAWSSSCKWGGSLRWHGKLAKYGSTNLEVKEIAQESDIMKNLNSHHLKNQANSQIR